MVNTTIFAVAMWSVHRDFLRAFCTPTHTPGWLFAEHYCCFFNTIVRYTQPIILKHDKKPARGGEEGMIGKRRNSSRYRHGGTEIPTFLFILWV